MKIKFLTLGVICAIIVACGGQQNTEATDTSSSTTAQQETASAESDSKGKQLIAQSDCLGCHKEREKLVGPAYSEVAAKYENTAENVTLLAGKIINGGQGVWGEVPMTAHPQISQADAEEMVKYILSIK